MVKFALLTFFAMLLICPCSFSIAAEPVAAGDAAPRSAGWWREQAAQFCAEIEDAGARSDAYHKLAYECGHANDLDAATAAATKVTAPLKGIYTRTFVAKQYHQQGNQSGAAKLLKAARQFAVRHEQELTNFGHSHLVQAYVELGRPDDGRKYADSIADPTQRSLAARELLAALAKHDLLDMQTAALSESEWLEVAFAYALEARVQETLAAAERIADESGRDRAYAALIEPLITPRKRWSEAETIVERITSPTAKAEAQKKLLRAWGREQTVDAIEARLAQASSRAEKVALFNELIPKLAADDRVDEAEDAIEAAVKIIQESPRPALISKFGKFDDAYAIAEVKSNYLLTAKSLSRQGREAAAQERIRWGEQPILALDPQTGLGKMMLVMALVGAIIDVGDLAGKSVSRCDRGAAAHGRLARREARSLRSAYRETVGGRQNRGSGTGD